MISVELGEVFKDGMEDTVIYNDGTSSTPIEAIVELYPDASDLPAAHGTILVKKSDVPTPEYRHTVTISGYVWTVNPGNGKSVILAEGDQTWLLRIQREEKVSSWRR